MNIEIRDKKLVDCLVENAMDQRTTPDKLAETALKRCNDLGLLKTIMVPGMTTEEWAYYKPQQEGNER